MQIKVLYALKGRKVAFDMVREVTLDVFFAKTTKNVPARLMKEYPNFFEGMEIIGWRKL